MIQFFYDLAKTLAVKASLIKPIYETVKVPIMETICKPTIKMIQNCTLWGLWCSNVSKETGGSSCFGKQKVYELCDLTGYEINPYAVGAIAVGGALLATSGYLFYRNYGKNTSNAIDYSGVDLSKVKIEGQKSKPTFVEIDYSGVDLSKVKTEGDSKKKITRLQ